MIVVKVDMRETTLIERCKYLLEISPLYKQITLEVVALPIGDIILEQEGQEKVIIERKSLQDLAASIKDGRYEEQSLRLTAQTIPNHNIVYLIEGDFNKMNMFKDRIDKTTLYSAMISLFYFKGFSVFRSFSLEETALLVLNMAHKIQKSEKEGRKPFYKRKIDSDVIIEKEVDLVQTNETNEIIDKEKEKEKDPDSNDNEEEQEQEQVNYVSVIKKVKKDNVTPENIGAIMLSQIPGISSTIALELMSHFHSLPQLLQTMQQNKTCLDQLTYTNQKGQTRKINKTVISNLHTYFQC